MTRRPFWFIRHRINKISELKTVSPSDGVEIDIRSKNGRLILTHDPHTNGDRLESYLSALRRRKITGPVIFNVKEDGHEDAIMRLAKKHRIENYFFLDTSMPTLIRLAYKQKNPNVAVRVSEHERADAALAFSGRVKWVWIDCFMGRPPSLATIKKLSKRFHICLVSPELQKFELNTIRRFRPLLPFVNAVCTKHPLLWK